MLRGNIFMLCAALVVGSFFIFSNTRAEGASIVITEIAAYATSTHEWVEIYNNGTEAADLTGWTFWEGGVVHRLAKPDNGSFVVGGRTHAIIAQDAGVFALDNPGFAGILFDSAWGSLSENGEEIGLKNAAGAFIERFTYVPAKNFALERVLLGQPDYSTVNWREHATGHTAGAINSVAGGVVAETPPVVPRPLPAGSAQPSVSLVTPTATLWAALRLSEIVPQPTEGREWVEIFNPTTEALDLAGGVICDSRAAKYCVVVRLSGEIGPGNRRVFTFPSGRLNDAGDQVILKNPTGGIVDQVQYGEEPLAPATGEAVARTLDGSWAITTELSPEASNTIRPPLAVLSLGLEAATSSAHRREIKAPAVKAKVLEAVVVLKSVYPKGGEPGEPLVFDASDSADPRGGSLFMEWYFSDGVRLEGARVTRTFAHSGTYGVSLAATSTMGTVGGKFFSLLIGHGISASGSGVVISEVFSDPEGADTREFIELTNFSTSSIEVGAWKLRTKNDAVFTVPPFTLIRPYASLVFRRAATRLSLINTGERVELINDSNDVVDSIAVPKAEAGRSYALFGGGWRWAEPTPGFRLAELVESAPAAPAGERPTATDAKRHNAKKAIKKNSKKIVAAVPATALAPSAARRLPKGRKVRVRGVVSAVPGTFGSQIFYVSDADGGVAVYQHRRLFPPLALGDVVEVAGTISFAQNRPRINIAAATNVDILDTGQELAPQAVTIAELHQASAGSLVAVTGEITERKGTAAYIDDGRDEIAMMLKTGVRIPAGSIIEGARATVIGIVESGAKGPELWPRNRQDIVPDTAGIVSVASTTSVVVVAEPTDPYAAATAGGGVAIVGGWIVRRRVFLVGIFRKTAALIVKVTRG